MKATKTFKMRGGRKVATLLGIASVVLACAAGTQTISSTGEFGESFIAGWETISYTGPTATYSGLFTANPGSQHGTTVEVFRIAPQEGCVEEITTVQLKSKKDEEGVAVFTTSVDFDIVFTVGTRSAAN